MVERQGEPAEVLRLVDDRPVPEPGPGQVRLRVLATGIGLPDVFLCRGTYAFSPPLPFVAGQEVCGVVEACGEGVELEVGSRLLGATDFPHGHGGFAERCLANVVSAFPAPPELDDADAAGFWIPHLTAWVGLVERGRLQPGEVVGVLGGAGSSGLGAVQLAKALGATVVAVASDQAKADLCRSYGADEVVAPGDDLPPLDLLYDPVGGEPGARAAGRLRRDGRWLLVGFAAGAWPALVPARVVRSNVDVLGVYAGGYSAEEVQGFHARLGELVAAGSLRGTVTERVPFGELPAALTRLGERRLAGKAALVP